MMQLILKNVNLILFSVAFFFGIYVATLHTHNKILKDKLKVAQSSCDAQVVATKIHEKKLLEDKLIRVNISSRIKNIQQEKVQIQNINEYLTKINLLYEQTQ